MINPIRENIDNNMRKAIEENIKDINLYIDKYLNTSKLASIMKITRYLQTTLFSEDILSKVLSLDSDLFVHTICAHQNLSKDFISKNLPKLYYTNALLNNPNIPNNIKTYIRMFI